MGRKKTRRSHKYESTAGSYLENIHLDYSISRNDQMASGIVQMIGFGVNLTAMTLLIVFAAMRGTATEIVSFSVFGAFINVYYIFSILYHTLINQNAKKVFSILRKATQYLVLVGTITPLCLVILNGMMGWFIWAGYIFLALLGLLNIVLNKSFRDTFYFLINTVLTGLSGALLILIYPRMNEYFVLWLVIIGSIILLGQVFKGMKGMNFNTALGHLMFVIANLGFFLVFFFYLAL